MHELALSKALVDALLRAANGRRVTAAHVTVGALYQLDVPAFEREVALLTCGTPATGVVLDIAVLPAASTCRACGHDWVSPRLPVQCDACGSRDVQAVGGSEFRLDTITVPASEAAPEADPNS